MENKTSTRFSDYFRGFLLNFGANRVKEDMEKVTIPICNLPDIIVNYFKENNERYLELVHMEAKNGDK